jgi:archaellum biogenesis protein FlaJ (TadC family)
MTISSTVKDVGKDEQKAITGVKLTEQQMRARRARSIAIAISLGVLVILFYIVTLVKGPAVLMRPL